MTNSAVGLPYKFCIILSAITMQEASAQFVPETSNDNDTRSSTASRRLAREHKNIQDQKSTVGIRPKDHSDQERQNQALKEKNKEERLRPPSWEQKEFEMGTAPTRLPDPAFPPPVSIGPEYDRPPPPPTIDVTPPPPPPKR